MRQGNTYRRARRIEAKRVAKELHEPFAKIWNEVRLNHINGWGLNVLPRNVPYVNDPRRKTYSEKPTEART